MFTNWIKVAIVLRALAGLLPECPNIDSMTASLSISPVLLLLLLCGIAELLSSLLLLLLLLLLSPSNIAKLNSR